MYSFFFFKKINNMVKIPIIVPEKSVKKGPEIKKRGKNITKYLLILIKKICFIKNLSIY